MRIRRKSRAYKWILAILETILAVVIVISIYLATAIIAFNIIMKFII